MRRAGTQWFEEDWNAMLFILLATVALGLGAAGLVLGLGKLTGLKPPRWMAPVAGGLAMFVFMLWNEYTWFDRSKATLPPDAEIAEAYPYTSWVQPWTLAAPRVTRFVAVAPAGAELAQPYAGRPELRLADVIPHQRFEGSVRVPHLFDCAGSRRAALSPADWSAIRSAAAPEPEGLAWVSPGAEDPLIRTACPTPPPKGDQT